MVISFLLVTLSVFIFLNRSDVYIEANTINCYNLPSVLQTEEPT